MGSKKEGGRIGWTFKYFFILSEFSWAHILKGCSEADANGFAKPPK